MLHNHLLLCQITPNRIFLFLFFWGTLFLFSFEVFALLVLLSLTALGISVDKTLLASRTLPEFSGNNSTLFEVEIGLVNDVLIFDANFLGIIKDSVWIFVFCQNFQYLLCSEYLKGINFRVDLISRGQKNCVSREFNFTNQLFLKFLRGFNFAN